ncbi:DNA invertase Pin-like site-specific DNA recombinase [Paenarthrobacter sp. TE4293]|uniref:recombinase family protein n=1 Tax=Paenarthrobacter sp. TE4293 TaxID=3381695 RepID=UPI003D1E668A
MARLGYARVSLAGRNTDLQIRELEAAGCERIHKDQGISGTRLSRPELDRVRKGWKGLSFSEADSTGGQ